MAVDDLLALYKINEVPTYFGQIQEKQIIDRLGQMKDIYNIFHTGLNTGHHAEAFLKHSKNLRWFVSCDETSHSYTEKVASYLLHLFPHKFFFLKGHSKMVIPLHAKVIEEIKFDLIFIDGKKSSEELISEIIQSKLIAHDQTFLWIDKYHHENVKKACDTLEMMGQIELLEHHYSKDKDNELIWVEAKFHS